MTETFVPVYIGEAIKSLTGSLTAPDRVKELCDLLFSGIRLEIVGEIEVKDNQSQLKAVTIIPQVGQPVEHGWKCCDRPRTQLISGSRSTEGDHTVEVCDSCGQFRIFGRTKGQHFSHRFSLYHPNALIAAGRPIERTRNDEPASPIADITNKSFEEIKNAAQIVDDVLAKYDGRSINSIVTAIQPSEIDELIRGARYLIEATKIRERRHARESSDHQ